jgi:hypothetical protein
MLRKENKKLSSKEYEILYGLLLGDLHCQTQRQDRTTFRLKFEAGDIHKQYLFHLYEIFKDWTLKPPKQYTRINHLGNKVVTWRFHTIATKEFGVIATEFYPCETKIVPSHLFDSKYMTNIALAYWFMDDGSYEKIGRKATILHTEGFTAEEVDFLVKGLTRRWGIKCSRHTSKNKYPIIYIWAQSLGRLKELIGPYLQPCMQYKLRIPSGEVDDIV